MTKEQRLAKYLLEHPTERGKNLLYKFEKSELFKKRASDMFQKLKELKSLEAVGKEFNVTRERVRQILTKEYGNDYKTTKAENNNFRKEESKRKAVRENTCLECDTKFLTVRRRGKFCSKDCMAKHKTKNEYPEWVGGRTLDPKNFTVQEWRILNNIRTKSYYHRNQKVMAEKRRLDQRKNRVKCLIYKKRTKERKKYGYAITPLKNPKNLSAIKP